MSKPLLPYEPWVQGTDPEVPWNDNALRSVILGGKDVNNATTAQPSLTSPADDYKAYIIQSTHTGAQWASFTPGSVAIFVGGGWYEFTAVDGARVSVGGTSYIYGSGTWSISGSGGSTATIPQNSQSAAYTLVLGDAGKHIFHPSADTTARIWTIPANSSVAFQVGTAVTFVNQNGAGVITIAITTDTMRLGGSGATGSRTLAANGVATALKVTSTEWIITGTGLT